VADTPDARRLIINADDFGRSEGVTRGIMEAHAAGSVTSTSIMANGIDWQNAVARARAVRTIGVGVHLNLVQGRPLLRVPSLTDARTGEFYGLGALARRALLGRVDVGELEAETIAQIERVRASGIAVTHLDSHRHAHVLPGIFKTVARATVQAGIRVLRIPREPLGLNLFDLAATDRKLVIGAALRASGGAMPPGPLVSADHFRGISLQGGRHFEARLRRTLDSLEPGVTELMVHPGHDDAVLASLDSYTWPRAIELAVLTSDEMRTRLARGDFTLINFGAL
jgi:chitin disaccharide deacetylase